MDIDAGVITAFRTDFPGFANVTAWPDNVVGRTLQHADRETGSGRWGGYADLSTKQRGMFLLAAHLLVADKQNNAVSAAGGVPTATARLQSKSVGDESVAFAVNSAPVGLGVGEEALNATAYGQEFIRIRRRVAAGAAGTGGLR